MLALRSLGVKCYLSCAKSSVRHYVQKAQFFFHHSIVSENFGENIFKKKIEKGLLQSINETIAIVGETDTSDTTMVATLNQVGSPIAFFSNTVIPMERKHVSIDKEVCMIIIAVKKWSHYLSGQKFTIITDQQAFSYVSLRKTGKDLKKKKSNGGG